MVDVKGNTISVGDKVVYIRNATSSPKIAVGTVTKVFTRRNKKDECSVDGNAHIYSDRVILASAI